MHRLFSWAGATALVIAASGGFGCLPGFAEPLTEAWLRELLAEPTLEKPSARGEPNITGRFPFSFQYGGKASDGLLQTWAREGRSDRLDACRERIVRRWHDPSAGLRVEWEAVRYSDFPAVEWVLHFENAGTVDTHILEDIRALDLTVRGWGGGKAACRLHRTKGAPSDPTDFEPRVVPVDAAHPQTLGAGGGRSSNRDFPFFKIEAGQASFIVAVGWSGQWEAKVWAEPAGDLRATAGMEKTRFLLHPGERVRSPRILVMGWEGDTLESNARFRQLIYKHYAAARAGAKPPPTPFCNTCFTRGGAWLNECTAENQISLIKAYAPLGLEALLTDAGWFEGGWPAGAGNWTPRKDAYPEGMAPVAAAAKAHGMIYGLWFEPERVVAGTGIHKQHPEWCLASRTEPQDTYLLNFGLPEVREYFFGIVKGFMDLPGFRVYRQDFNMDPLPYWRFNDAPDRQGITEMKYVEGLYAYWDRIAEAWPDGLREECASGGRRIDLETIRRMHVHQKSDYWFDNEVDQASLWSLSQYLPNGVISVPLNRLDDYSFHSVLPSSLIPGWIADAPGFDAARGKALLDRYRAVRHLLNGAWYPLLPYSRDAGQWMASQYHRPDLDEGMVLVFRRVESAYRSTEVSLRGLAAGAAYEFASDRTGEKTRVAGGGEGTPLHLALPERRQSDLVVYRRIKE